MSIKSVVLKGLAIYGLVRLTQDLTNISITDNVNTLEKAMAHRMVEVIFDDGSEMTVTFSKIEDARDAIGQMHDILKARGFVTVEDLKDLVGIDPYYADTYYGWKTLEGARIVRVKKIILDKYALHMPRPKKMWG